MVIASKQIRYTYVVRFPQKVCQGKQHDMTDIRSSIGKGAYDMKSVGLDTCVVVRLLIGEPEDQAETAIKYVEQCFYEGIQVCVSDIVVGEVYYALIYTLNG